MVGILCPYGPYMIHRHDAIRDTIAKYIQQAQYSCKTEQRQYDYDAELAGLENEIGRYLEIYWLIHGTI